MITSGNNGYTANAGYNLVTGLGTPVANLLVGDLVAYHGPGTTYAGPTVGALQDATLVNTWSNGSDNASVFSVFAAITVSSGGLRHDQGPGAASTVSTPMSGTPVQEVVASHSAGTPLTTFGATVEQAAGSLSQSGPVQARGWATNSSSLGQTSRSPAATTITSVFTGLFTHETAWATPQVVVSSPVTSVNSGGARATDSVELGGLIPSRSRTGVVSEAVLDELAADSVLWPAQEGSGTITIPVLPAHAVTRNSVIGDSLLYRNHSLPPTDYAAGLAVLGLAAGFWARGAVFMDDRTRQSGRLVSKRKIDSNQSSVSRTV